MSKVGRIAGAMLVETEGRYVLVGYPKQPIDWRERGFVAPPSIDQWPGPRFAMEALGTVDLGETWLELEVEGAALLQLLEARLLVARNGSVSERLWRLIIGESDDTQAIPGPKNVRWLSEMPATLWDILRDTVLRCS